MDKKEFENLQGFVKGTGQPNSGAPKFVGQPDDDGPDLTKAMIFCDSASGVYIPQRFAKEVIRMYVTGVADKDYEVLEAGPDHAHYWDAWADVLDNAKITDPKVGECYLHQDGDLWVVPVEKEEEKSLGTRVLGHTFVPFTKEDWYGLAGADEGSLICHCDDVTLILSPDGSISEIICDDTGNPTQYDWTKEQII
jgi:hypothetical protein